MKTDDKQVGNRLLKILVVILEIVGFLVIVYLIVLPLYPSLIYNLFYKKTVKTEIVQNIEEVKKEVREFRNSLPDSGYSVSENRLIIKKIGVNAPIVESNNEQYGLSKGAWRVPESSTPDKGGNTVITGHRFKYLPPNNLTFYLFNELSKGDLVSVIWGENDFIYKIRETKIVPSTEISIMNNTKDSIITMYTCDPIYSTKNRLVIIAELLK